MEPLCSVSIPTNHGSKTISVFGADILLFDRQIDILTTSAFHRSYHPAPKTLFHALHEIGISVLSLAIAPQFDLRTPCNIWLSKSIQKPGRHIHRIGCVEMVHHTHAVGGFLTRNVDEQEMLKSIKAYFQMLDLAATCDIKMETIALPVLGSGLQSISEDLILIPLLNECVAFLKRNRAVKQIYFIERSPQKAFKAAQTLANSYSIRQEQAAEKDYGQTQKQVRPLAFISYASPDRNVADNLCAKLEAQGIQVWYAPRNVVGDYASSIADAIVKASHFIVILSKNSMASQHVLNEVDLAFQKLPNNIKFHPLRIDDETFAPAFNYYLSRQHWMDAYIPPLEARLLEFVAHLAESL